ncbi:MAG TPA: magnesium transporter CorA family protein [Dermatophilaceae bacterium]|nr:magnesium transporter CorA family protein [Dermatophilaceae bacterium]
MTIDMTIDAARVRSRVWRDGRLVADAIPISEISDRIADPSVLVWVDLLAPTRDELLTVAEELGLDPTAVEDVLEPHERPKVMRHTDHLFFVTYATRIAEPTGDPDGGGRLRLSRVSGFVLPSALVTVRSDTDGLDLDDVLRRWDGNADLLVHGPGALLHGLLDAIVDGQFAAIQRLDDDIEALEDELFEDRADRVFLRRVYGLRKDLVRLRRVVLPMREVVNGLLRHRPADGSELERWYDDLYDHVLRAAEWTECLRDMVTTVFETNLSLQDTRLNTVMKQLAAWAAIIAVPTAVTGWFGQNVPYPGFQEPAGLWLSVALIVVLGGSLYAVFRARDWI